MDRRNFLISAATAGLAGQTFSSRGVEAAETVDASKKSGARVGNPIALSTYSLWRFHNEPFRDIHRRCSICELVAA
jgi:hypothetical protein